MPARPHRRLAPLLMLSAALIAGCEGSKAPAPAPVKTRETLRKTTQDVLKLDDALAQGGVQQNTSPTSGAVAQKTAEMVAYSIQLRNASNIQDPRPLTYDELMTEVIKKGQADGMQLPTLPYYQEYAWDEANQKLVVVEFPKRKEPGK